MCYKNAVIRSVFIFNLLLISASVLVCQSVFARGYSLKCISAPPYCQKYVDITVHGGTVHFHFVFDAR